jgi:hypothetical protein
MTLKRQALAAWTVASAVVAAAVTQALLPWPGVANSPTVEDLLVRVAALEAKLACVTASGTDVIFEGCNVHVQNGLGGTDTTNGLGNLIVGHNENFPPPSKPAVRTGSHNLVVGPFHTFSSHGGLVAGRENTVSGTNASVTAGSLNKATAFAASVSGGRSNEAKSPGASVSGGTQNVAGMDETDGQDASVSGGFQNEASGFSSSASGGNSRSAGGPFDWVAGTLLEDD